MATQNHFTAAESAALSQMLEAPEVIEVHGNDTAWKTSLVGALMATAAMSFAPAVHADGLFERTMSSVATNVMAGGVRKTMEAGFDVVGRNVKQTVYGDTPGSAVPQQGVLRTSTSQAAARPSLAAALGFGRSDVPRTNEELADVMLRNDVGSIAATSSLRPVLFPVVVTSGNEFSQVDDAARRAAAAVPPAGQGAQGLLRDNLLRSKDNGPAAVMYMGSVPNTAGCLIVMHADRADYAQRMSRMTGLSMKEAMDFAVLHEAAHCAQQGESIAAQLEAQSGLGAQARQRISYSGLVDVHTERAIQGGNVSRLNNPETVDKAQRSAERYADAFAALAMNAQQPLNGQQWNGIASWRMNSGGHDTSNFVRWVQDQVQRDPIGREAMKAEAGAGYNAQAVASFLKPIWKQFEARELELDQNRQRANQGSRPAERVTQVPAERVSLAAQFGIRPADNAAGAQRNDPRGYTDEDMQQLLNGAPRPR